MTSIASVQEVRRDVAATGIQLLDEKLQGGFPRDSTLLLFSEIPAEKRVFAEHFVMTGVKNNEICLYVDFFRAPQLARRELLKFGSYPENKLLLVDATSSQLLLPSQERYSINNVEDIEEIFRVISLAVNETKPRRIVIDSIEFLADRFPQDEVINFWRKLDVEAHKVGATLCFLFINWRSDNPELGDMRSMADFAIEFRSTISGGIVKNMMRIEETKTGGFRTNWVPYMFKDLIGVRVYFPRILVTGPINAGKSTVVKNLCNTSVNIDRMGTTVSFDYGNVSTMGLEAEVFGTPGQERFEFIFKIFAREINGILLVVDASRPEDLQKAKKMLDLVGGDQPFVVLANKSDLSGAMSPEEVRKAIGLGDNVDVVSSIATEGKGLEDALKILAEQIIGVK